MPRKRPTPFPPLLVVDPEFRDLIPPLQLHERDALRASIAAEGCKDPIRYWSRGPGDNVIVDGHNRHQICRDLGLNFPSLAMTFPDRDAVRAWMLQHQTARRNITPDQLAMLMAITGTFENGRGVSPLNYARAAQLFGARQHGAVLSGGCTLKSAYDELFPPAPRRAPAEHPPAPAPAPRASSTAAEVGDELTIANMRIDALQQELRSIRATKPAADTESVFVWPDTHAPYHDPLAVAVACAAVREARPKILVVLGDLFDFYAVSFYSKDVSRKALLAQEIDDARCVVEAIEALGVERVVFTCGNHEHRLDRFIADRAPALTGLVKRVRDLLPSRWEFVTYGKAWQHGKMLYSHDFGRSGVNASRQGLIDVGANIAFGHTHQLNVSTIGQQRGDSHVALNAGWLGDYEKIDYRHAALAKRSYQHGFGIVHQDARGNVYAVPVPIVGGGCVVNGRVVSVA